MYRFLRFTTQICSSFNSFLSSKKIKCISTRSCCFSLMKHLYARENHILNENIICTVKLGFLLANFCGMKACRRKHTYNLVRGTRVVRPQFRIETEHDSISVSRRNRALRSKFRRLPYKTRPLMGP